MQEMVIYGVSFDMVGKQPIVLLKTRDGNKFLPIWIGHPEAAAILMKLQGANTPRPMTHDLISDMLGELEVACTRVAVTELRENTFYAAVTLAGFSSSCSTSSVTYQEVTPPGGGNEGGGGPVSNGPGVKPPPPRLRTAPSVICA